MPVGIVPLASTEEAATSTAEPTVVPGTAVVAAGEGVPPVGSTHIPLPAANAPQVVEASLPAVEVAPVQIEKVETPKDEPAPEPAPPVLAAEPVSDTKDEPKETTPASNDVTVGGLVSSSNSNWAAMMAAAMPKPKPVVDAAPVAAVPTATAVTTQQETEAEVTVSEEKPIAPEVLAAPPADVENKEVAPVEESGPIEASKPIEEPKPIEESKPLAEEPKSVEEPKETEPKAAETAAPGSAPSTPKKETPSAPTTPASNGKPTPSRSSTLRGLKFPGHRRQSSGDVTPEKPRSASASIKDSSRKKRVSIFGRVKEAFHKDKTPEKP